MISGVGRHASHVQFRKDVFTSAAGDLSRIDTDSFGVIAEILTGCPR